MALTDQKKPQDVSKEPVDTSSSESDEEPEIEAEQAESNTGEPVSEDSLDMDGEEASEEFDESTDPEVAESAEVPTDDEGVDEAEPQAGESEGAESRAGEAEDEASDVVDKRKEALESLRKKVDKTANEQQVPGPPKTAGDDDEVMEVGVVAETAKSNVDVLLSELQSRNRKIIELKQAVRDANEQGSESEELQRAHDELQTTYEELREAHEELQNERDEINDRMLRVAADLENFRRRAERDKKELKKYGIKDVVSELIPAVDNMERALEHVDEREAEGSFVDGVRMVYRQVVSGLEKHGVKGFDSVGEQFNPERHEAIQQVESKDKETGTIVEEFQKGYFLHDRLLRPALVSVAKRVEAQQDEDSTEEAGEQPSGETDVDEESVAGESSVEEASAPEQDEGEHGESVGEADESEDFGEDGSADEERSDDVLGGPSDDEPEPED